MCYVVQTLLKLNSLKVILLDHSGISMWTFAFVSKGGILVNPSNEQEHSPASRGKCNPHLDSQTPFRLAAVKRCSGSGHQCVCIGLLVPIL